METLQTGTAGAGGALKGVSINRLTSLARHWAWADEAMTRFERELERRWEDDEDAPADHLLGAYYHWCALLCGFSEAAVDELLLSSSQMRAIRPDLEACLPLLKASRQLLVVIPASREDYLRMVDLFREENGLNRLRRLHEAFGQAIREEQASRTLELLDAHER